MGRQKWYAVAQGRKSGLFTSWADCEKQVHGFSGAVFKSFATEEEAIEFLRARNVEVTSTHKAASATPPARSTAEKVEPNLKRKREETRKSPIVAKPTFRPKTSDAWRTAPRYVEVYTDGACKGNANVAVTKPPAGWGYLVVGRAKGGKPEVLHEAYGPVILDRVHEDFLGAEVLSNNTGELSAIGHALSFLFEDSSAWKDTPAVIRFDSKYAAFSVNGLYNGQKNQALIMHCREKLEKALTLRPIDFLHVKGHSNDTFNDRADYLANLGAGLSNMGSSSSSKRPRV